MRRAVSATFRSGFDSELARNQATASPTTSAKAPIPISARIALRTRAWTASRLCVTRTMPTTRPLFVTGTAV